MRLSLLVHGVSKQKVHMCDDNDNTDVGVIYTLHTFVATPISFTMEPRSSAMPITSWTQATFFALQLVRALVASSAALSMLLARLSRSVAQAVLLLAPQSLTAWVTSVAA